MEQTNLQPYRCLLESDQLVRVYLDELPAAGPDQFGVALLELIAAKPEASLKRAQALVPQVRASGQPEKVRARLLEFIETVIVYQFPEWPRAEIQKVLTVTDATQTRVYQKGLEDGRKEASRRASKP